MKQSQAIKLLNEWDLRDRYVFTAADMTKVFHADAPRAREATIKRLWKEGILERPVKGVYLYAYSRHKGPDTIEMIASTLRRGAYNYVSLESALSEYGLISQIPVGYLSVMTTGRKGEYRTPYGTIEFTHTERPLKVVLSSMLDRNRPLKIASKSAALRDLKRVGRNLHLVDESYMDEDE